MVPVLSSSPVSDSVLPASLTTCPRLGPPFMGNGPDQTQVQKPWNPQCTSLDHGNSGAWGKAASAAFPHRQPSSCAPSVLREWVGWEERRKLTSDHSRAAHSGGHIGPWQASSTGGRGCGQALSSRAFSSAADTRRWHTTERLRTPASQVRLHRDQFPTAQL